MFFVSPHTFQFGLFSDAAIIESSVLHLSSGSNIGKSSDSQSINILLSPQSPLCVVRLFTAYEKNILQEPEAYCFSKVSQFVCQLFANVELLILSKKLAL